MIVRAVRKAEIGAKRIAMFSPIVGSEDLCVGNVMGLLVGLRRSSLEAAWVRQAERATPRWANAKTLVVKTIAGSEGWNWQGETVWKRGPGLSLFCDSDRMLEVASGALRLVDLPTGAVLHETAGREGVPILLLDGLALFRSIDASSVWAASVADGRVTWSKNLLGDMSTALGAHDPYGVLGVAADGSGCAVVAYGSCLFGVSTSDGSILWGRPLEVPYRAPQARDGRVYVWSTSVSAETTTFDLSTGEVRREPQAGTTNRLVILDKTTGRVLLDRDLSEHGPEFAARQRPEYPAVGCDHIVFTTDAGLLAAFRLSDGELVWKHKLGVQPFEATVAGHEIYVPCADGTLLVFECEDGEL